MLMRLLLLASAEPRVLAAHARAYADLAGADVQRATRQGMMQLLMGLAAVCAVAAAAVLAGVAWMLWALGAALAGGGTASVWVFIAPPVLATCVALACWTAVTRGGWPDPLKRVRSEWARDRVLLGGEEGPP